MTWDDGLFVVVEVYFWLEQYWPWIVAGLIALAFLVLAGYAINKPEEHGQVLTIKMSTEMRAYLEREQRNLWIEEDKEVRLEDIAECLLVSAISHIKTNDEPEGGMRITERLER